MSRLRLYLLQEKVFRLEKEMSRLYRINDFESAEQVQQEAEEVRMKITSEVCKVINRVKKNRGCRCNPDETGRIWTFGVDGVKPDRDVHIFSTRTTYDCHGCEVIKRKDGGWDSLDHHCVNCGYPILY